jgi:DNA polymerase III sliding clamp (beta) subunit (PCNA family)
MEVIGTSSVITIRAKVQVEGARKGLWSVNATQLIRVLNYLDAEIVNCIPDENNLVFKTESSRVALPFQFKAFEPVQDEWTDEWEVEKLMEYGVECLHALDSKADNSNPMTESLCIAVAADNSLKITAYDGCRIAERDELTGPVVKKLVVHGKPLVQAYQILAPDARLRMAVSDHHVRLADETTEVIISVVNREYPDIDKSLKHESNLLVRVNRNDLINAIQLVKSVIINDRKLKQAVTLRVMDNTMTVACVGSGTAQRKLKAKSKIKNERISYPFIIGFSVSSSNNLLLDALNSLTGEWVDFDFNEACKPAILRNPQNKVAREIVCPVRLD